MSQLAIRGHVTRGKEVIEILQMLGGVNTYLLSGVGRETIYYIKGPNICCVCDRNLLPRRHIIFSFETFQKKFPYKVGDRVYYDNKVCDVIKMLWNSNLKTVSYGVYDGEIKNLATVKELKPYKETMEERQYKELRMPLDDNDKLATEVTIGSNIILPPNGYLIGKITQVDNGMLVEYVKKRPQYPKTYEECCKIVNVSPYVKLVYNISDGHNYSYDEDNLQLHENIRRLKICRDAYWKIAGEEMGLGKPWEPDFDNGNEYKYGLFRIRNTIYKDATCTDPTLLIFPIGEIRDVFYDNFKDLIEECKELL